MNETIFVWRVFFSRLISLLLSMCSYPFFSGVCLNNRLHFASCERLLNTLDVKFGALILQAIWAVRSECVNFNLPRINRLHILESSGEAVQQNWGVVKVDKDHFVGVLARLIRFQFLHDLILVTRVITLVTSFALQEISRVRISQQKHLCVIWIEATQGILAWLLFVKPQIIPSRRSWTLSRNDQRKGGFLVAARFLKINEVVGFEGDRKSDNQTCLNVILLDNLQQILLLAKIWNWGGLLFTESCICARYFNANVDALWGLLGGCNQI